MELREPVVSMRREPFKWRPHKNGAVQNLFRVGRHLLCAAHYRLLRILAFVEWDAVTCAC